MMCSPTRSPTKAMEEKAEAAKKKQRAANRKASERGRKDTGGGGRSAPVVKCCGVRRMMSDMLSACIKHGQLSRAIASSTRWLQPAGRLTQRLALLCSIRYARAVRRMTHSQRPQRHA